LIGWGIAPQIAAAQIPNLPPDLIAQDVLNGLPPAPPLPPGFSNPEPTLRAPSNPQFNAAPTSPSAGRYLVLVNGDSPELLTQVRRIEAGAFVQEHDGKRVIQVGLYSSEANAQQRVDTLEQEGIRAKVVNVSGEAATNPQLNAGGTAENSRVAQAESEDWGNSAPYYVVIPGDSDILPANRPLGNHVRVGPFSGRRAAARWSRYFRDFGIDARVDYRR
jgi:SPOR domain